MVLDTHKNKGRSVQFRCCIRKHYKLKCNTFCAVSQVLQWCTRKRFIAAHAPWLRLYCSLFHLMLAELFQQVLKRPSTTFYSGLHHTCDEKAAAAIKTKHTFFLPSSSSVNRKPVCTSRIDTTQGGELVLQCILIPNMLCTMQHNHCICAFNLDVIGQISLQIKKKKPLLFQYSVSNHPLIEVNEYKYLGITLTNTLSWNTHIANVASSAFRKLCLLRHKLREAPPQVKLLAYNPLIRPKMEYACVVWDPHTKKNINSLEKIQRHAVRFIYSVYGRNVSVTKTMQNHGIVTLESR